MRPRVGNLPGQPVGKATVDPNLKGLVVRLAIGLTHGDRPKIREHATGIYNACQVGITGGECLNHGRPLAWENVVDGHAAPPDFRSVITNIRNLGHGIFQNLARHRYVPLPAFGWSEIFVYRVEAGAVAHARECVFQSRIYGVETAESWVVRQICRATAPVGVDYCRPRRIAGQPQHIFNHVRTAHETAEPHAHCRLAITLDVPCHTYARLETFVIGVP